MKKKIAYAALALILVGCSVIFGVIGVYKTENGIVLGLPDYEKRDIHVSQVDLDILAKADALLSSKDSWSKARIPDCAQPGKLDLYCALQIASVKALGKYVHRQPALQEVRFAIDDHYRKRWEKHRLIDFNGNKATSFNDVKSVLAQAMATVRDKLAHYKAQQ